MAQMFLQLNLTFACDACNPNHFSRSSRNTRSGCMNYVMIQSFREWNELKNSVSVFFLCVCVCFLTFANFCQKMQKNGINQL